MLLLTRPKGIIRKMNDMTCILLIGLLAVAEFPPAINVAFLIRFLWLIKKIVGPQEIDLTASCNCQFANLQVN